MFVRGKKGHIPRKRALLRLIPYLKEYRKRLIQGSVMVLLTNAAAVISPWVLRNAIDDLAREMSHSRLLAYSGLIVFVSLTEGSFRFFMRRIMIGVSRWIEFDLRNDLFAHLQRLSTDFYRKHSTGDLMARATNDLSAVRSVLGPGIMYSLNTLFNTVFTVGLLLTIDARLALVTLIPLALVSLTVRWVGKMIHQRFERIQEQFSELTTLAQENISGIRVVKSYSQENAFIGLFKNANSRYISRNLDLVKVQGLYNPTLVALLGLSSLAVLWYGGSLVIRQQITIGDLVAFMAYLVMLTWPTIALGWVINVVERGSASMGRINRILDTVPQITVENPAPVRGIRGEIEVRNLNFSIDGTPILRDISFRVPAGGTLAIVGKTGSGKSTIANLLCRLSPVRRGAMFIDGTDINDIDLDVLRKSIGYVPQDAFLFSDSISGNVALGRPDAQVESIEEVAKVSQVWADVDEFPDRFQTLVGERGITLSGGQKQRLTISRALLADPRILILDDALSSVDTYTEERILKALDREMEERTVIFISHRISTIKMADQILVLDQGRLVERGSHRELLAIGGQYARLYEQQLLKEELGIE